MAGSPAPQRIEVSDGSEVVLTWTDQTETRLSAAELRAMCPCAECREEPGRRHIERLLASADPVVVTDARLVGAYAVNFVFGPDGHGTGIFPFSGLHELRNRDAGSAAVDTGP